MELNMPSLKLLGEDLMWSYFFDRKKDLVRLDARDNRVEIRVGAVQPWTDPLSFFKLYNNYFHKF